MSQEIALTSRCEYIAELLKNGEESVFHSTTELLHSILNTNEVAALEVLAGWRNTDAMLMAALEKLRADGGFLESLASYTDHEFRVLKDQLAHPDELRSALDAVGMPEVPLPIRLIGYVRALYQTRYFDIDNPRMLQEMRGELAALADHHAAQEAIDRAGEDHPPVPAPGSLDAPAPEGRFVTRIGSGKPLDVADEPAPNAVVMFPGIDAISNKSYSGALKAPETLFNDCPDVTVQSYVFTTPEENRWEYDREIILYGKDGRYACPEAREYVEKFILPEILEDGAFSADKLNAFHRQFFGNSFGARFIMRIENAVRDALSEREDMTDTQKREVFDRITTVTVSSPDLIYQRDPSAPGFRTLHIFSADDSGTALPRPFLEATHLNPAIANATQPTLQYLDGTQEAAGENLYRNSLLFIPHGQVLEAVTARGEHIDERQHNPGDYTAWIAKEGNEEVKALVQKMLKGPEAGEDIHAFHRDLDTMLCTMETVSRPQPFHEKYCAPTTADAVPIAKTWVAAIQEGKEAAAIGHVA